MPKTTYLKAKLDEYEKAAFVDRCVEIGLSPSEVLRDIQANFVLAHTSQHVVDVNLCKCSGRDVFAIVVELQGAPITGEFVLPLPDIQGWELRSLPTWEARDPDGNLMGRLAGNTWQGRVEPNGRKPTSIERVRHDINTLFHKIAHQVTIAEALERLSS